MYSHRSHLRQRNRHQRRPETSKQTPINHARRPPIEKRELECHGRSLPRTLEDEAEVDGGDEVDVALEDMINTTC